MSGGSFNHLAYADDLLDREDDLRDMADTLAALGYAEDAARETEELICIIRQAKVRIQARADRLHGVWRAVEWWHSGDSSQESFKGALHIYRGGD